VVILAQKAQNALLSQTLLGSSFSSLQANIGKSVVVKRKGTSKILDERDKK